MKIRRAEVVSNVSPGNKKRLQQTNFLNQRPILKGNGTQLSGEKRQTRRRYNVNFEIFPHASEESRLSFGPIAPLLAAAKRPSWETTDTPPRNFRIAAA